MTNGITEQFRGVGVAGLLSSSKGENDKRVGEKNHEMFVQMTERKRETLTLYYYN